MKRAAHILALLSATLVGCAALFGLATDPYVAASRVCIADAGTRAEADACRCKVRIQYPNVPQCAALPDGGWVVPSESTDAGGVRKDGGTP